ELAKKAKQILYLTDNAGEIAFDTLLVQELKQLGPLVTVAVKDEPIGNDATMQDAEYVKMHETADDIITNGTDTVGIILEECSKRFLALYNSVDLVVAKGMGHAETFTELNLTRPHALLFRTKCSPVARFFGVGRNKNVAKLML
ncbi:MAG: ARMT1-like domain-containing protein, partial [Candidatus Bathyarchaeota archaeon]